MNDETKMITVPFAMYEARCLQYEEIIEKQQEKFIGLVNTEKEDKYKSLRSLKACCISLALIIALIIGCFAVEAYYFFTSYGFQSYVFEQDGNGVNNVNEGTQGDLINGANTP